MENKKNDIQSLMITMPNLKCTYKNVKKEQRYKIDLQRSGMLLIFFLLTFGLL